VVSDEIAALEHLRDGERWHEYRFILPRVPAAKKAVRDDYLCGRFIELATHFTRQGLCSGIVTGPIDKNHLNRGGYRYPGHTEMLQDLCGSKTVTMMMASPGMKVSLVTCHLPLSKVGSALSRGAILTTIRNTAAGLKQLYGMKRPRIAVLGVNPHAGDGGLFGKEEIRVIAPAVAAARRAGFAVQGPFPPDGFFAQWRRLRSKQFDAVVCMYHDQALVPVKLYDFENAVNVTLGLPVVRTSVDHGTGFDIAGKGIADPSSFIAALKLAKSAV
jgi:4-hydroxythreonine-4-phosphate dehydrogenase